MHSTIISRASLLALVALVGCSAPAGNRLLDGEDPRGNVGGSGGGGGGAGATGSGGAGGSSQGGGGSSGGSSGPTTPAPQAQLAQGLGIREIAVFQGVKVSIAKAGVKVATRKMPVVAKRDGLLRVYVDVGSGWTPHAVTAELHIVAGGTAMPVLRDQKTISASSTESDLGSTFDFDVPGSSLPVGATYFVQLVDTTAPMVRTDQQNAAQYPSTGTVESLDAQSAGDKLKVVLVPVAYAADGSGRLPPTTATEIDALRKRMLELYPIPAVEITVHAPISFSDAITADGNQGWDTLVTTIAQLRAQDAAPPDVYYYGAFSPAASLASYCPQGCVLGLASGIAPVGDPTERAAIGVLFNDAVTLDTMPHEIGHAHGRQHAPCGNAAGADAQYPYAGGKIGSWGYSILTKALFDPATYADQMSYCHPSWQSDYSFAALFTRLKVVNQADLLFPAPAPKSEPGTPQAFRFVTVHGDGTLSWNPGGAVRMDHELAGDAKQVHFRDGGDREMAATTARYYPFDHLPGGYLLVPEGPTGFARAVVDDLPVPGSGVLAAEAP